MSDEGGGSLFDVPLEEIVKIAITLTKNIGSETLSALLILSIVLAVLAALMFGKKLSERIRLVAFCLVSVFFSGIAFAAIILSTPPEVTPPRDDLLSEELSVAPQSEEIIVLATEVTGGTKIAVGPLAHVYGADVLMNGPPFGETANAATFLVDAEVGGDYLLEIRKADAEGRPLNVIINGSTQLVSAAPDRTGGWTQSDQRWIEAGTVSLEKGKNSVELQRASVFPHITALRFIK